MALSAVVPKGEPWNEQTRQLVQDLDRIGLSLGKNDRPRAPLELLADDDRRPEFCVLMERHLETLTG